MNIAHLAENRLATESRFKDHRPTAVKWVGRPACQW